MTTKRLLNIEMQKIQSLITGPLGHEETESYIKDGIRSILNLNYHEDWIRGNPYRLSSTRFGLAFAMSGYDDFDFKGENGDCDKYNRYILNLFVDGLNLSKDMRFMYLDFYKGMVEFYYDWWNFNPTLNIENYGGETTTNIIYSIIKLCLIDNPQKNTRRRKN